VDAPVLCTESRERVHIYRDTTRGQETTLFSILTNLMHFGMVIVGCLQPSGQMTLTRFLDAPIRRHVDSRR